MKFMTKLENIVMNRTGCDRWVANLVANDILAENQRIKSIYEIVTHYGEIVGCVTAYDDRQALCIYLLDHEEMDDAMLWRDVNNLWKLAEYDDEDNFLFARPA